MNSHIDKRCALEGARSCSLCEILDAREKRAHRQKQFLMQGGTLICFTLNLAGPIKTAPLFIQAFEEGVHQIKSQLRRSSCIIRREKEFREPTGCEFFAHIDASPFTIKKWMVEIEEGSSIGRIFDIDVMTEKDGKISRAMLGLEERRCLLCNDAAKICARSQRHPLSLIQKKTIELISQYFEDRFAQKVASNACRALLYEVAVSPKPGLVDRFHSGSHHDMDFFTFLDSAAVLTPFFYHFVKKGLLLSDEPEEQLLPHLRYPGKLAEDAMLKTTGGVNTHKGIIFSLGVLCASLGWCYGRGLACDTQRIILTARKICTNLLNDFQGLCESGNSSGEDLYLRFGITGIRGQAIRGFPSVYEVGLPNLKRLLKKGLSCNDAGAITLLHLVSCTEDTNIISRSSPKTLQEVQCQVRELLPKLEDDLAQIHSLDLQFIKKNISPGGCADLLSLCWFLYFMEQDSEEDTLSII